MLARSLFILNLLGSCASDSITIYEYSFYEGDYEKILLNSDGCVNLPDFLMGRTNSARVNVDCVALFDGEDCTGESVKLKRNSPTLNNLRKQYFEYKFVAVKRCRNFKQTKTSYARGLCVEEHNEARAKYGLSPLEVNAYLENASQKHIEMVHKEECQLGGSPHRCPGEKHLMNRIEDAGYRNLKSGAENIAIGYGDCRSVVEGWMTSGGHRRNILKGYRHMGCGKKLDKWACTFASPFPRTFLDDTESEFTVEMSGGWSSHATW